MLRDFENAFDLDRNISRQRIGTRGTASTDTILRSEDVSKEFTATIYHGGMLLEIICAINQTKKFYNPMNAIQATEFIDERREDCHSRMIRSSFAGIQIEIGSNSSGDTGTIRLQWRVTRNIGKVPNDDYRTIEAVRLRCRWQRKI